MMLTSRRALTLGALPLVILQTLVSGGCKTSGAGTACQGGGGQCFLGSYLALCDSVAPDAEQDCNPDQNPGGGFCCLSEPGDAGAPDASDASRSASADAALPACSWPAIYDVADAASVGATGQCTAARALLSCKGSNGGGEECGSDNLTQCPGPNATPGVTYSGCQDQCQPDEYVLFCGTIGPPTSPPSANSAPPASCRMALANPSGREPYCCPCSP